MFATSYQALDKLFINNKFPVKNVILNKVKLLLNKRRI